MKSILGWRSVAGLAIACMACQQKSSGETSATNAQVAQAGNSARCNVQGVWRLDSVVVDGKVQAMGAWKQMKVISGTHYSWVSQEGGPMRLATTADSLAAYRTRGSGGGTYRVTDSSYVERLDFFSDPAHIGREVEITCRVTGTRWDHSYDWARIEKGKYDTIHVQEIWRRVE